MPPCVTPLPRVDSATEISSELTMRSNTARLVGSASVRMTVLMEAVWVIGDELAWANALVKTNLYALSCFGNTTADMTIRPIVSYPDSRLTCPRSP